ncbi:hypothetical protein VFPFJ_03972 [Purpureocillium lilacinum]|uniref:Uncharacterized protein n=1 Tax=Purpureocillium lilacinum TaxID=33203 RepID=A0A179HQU0_PURLI|nr:hypothetical protein VFPFJ_03972 [Purpureocillium lilacinum]OAQ92232.1 hypothetical protein VFPFJ_03972 [Purpureocillium lilacinum]
MAQMQSILPCSRAAEAPTSAPQRPGHWAPRVKLESVVPVEGRTRLPDSQEVGAAAFQTPAQRVPGKTRCDAPVADPSRLNGGGWPDDVCSSLGEMRTDRVERRPWWLETGEARGRDVTTRSSLTQARASSANGQSYCRRRETEVVMSERRWAGDRAPVHVDFCCLRLCLASEAAPGGPVSRPIAPRPPGPNSMGSRVHGIVRRSAGQIADEGGRTRRQQMSWDRRARVGRSPFVAFGSHVVGGHCGI